MTSLVGRLVLVVLAVALLAVGATAWVAQQVTRDDLEDAYQRDLQAEQDIYQQLATYAFFGESWEGVQPVVDTLAAEYDERIAITTPAGEALADSDRTGADLPRREVAFIDPTNPALAFELPETELVFQPEDLGLDFTGIIECLEGEDIPFELTDGPDAGFPGPVVTDVDGNGFVSERCFAQSEAGVATSEAGVSRSGAGGLQALLFVGTGADAEPSLLGGGPDLRLVLVVLVVFTVAGLATWLAVRAMLAPVDRLAAAADRVGAGDFSVRVHEGGPDELARLSASFNQMSASIESEDERRRRFTSDVAHELRTPLANVRGYLESAQDGVSPIDRALIDSLHDDALHLERLVDDLGVLTSAGAGELRISPQPVDLRESLEAIVSAHGPNAAEKGVDLALTSVDELTIAVDPDRFRQIVANLVTNAIRHTDAGGSVRLGAASRDGMVELSVTDTGEGIAPEHLPRLFERFFRVDSSRTRTTGGSGLGLAITRELVQAHGGTITVQSEPGKGTMFTVLLPL